MSAAHARHPVGSMGQVGVAGDSAAMESFATLLQKKVPERRQWPTGEEFRIAIFIEIELAYHRRRPRARLDRSTPIEYRNMMNFAA